MLSVCKPTFQILVALEQSRFSNRPNHNGNSSQKGLQSFKYKLKNALARSLSQSKHTILTNRKKIIKITIHCCSTKSEKLSNVEKKGADFEACKHIKDDMKIK